MACPMDFGTGSTKPGCVWVRFPGELLPQQPCVRLKPHHTGVRLEQGFLFVHGEPLNENEESVYLGCGIYGIRDKITKETIRIDEPFIPNPMLSREDIFELGRKGPYFRFAEFPVEVTVEIELGIGINESYQAASTG